MGRRQGKAWGEARQGMRGGGNARQGGKARHMKAEEVRHSTGEEARHGRREHTVL